MQSYIVETYVPRLGEAECRATAARARQATEELSRDGSSVRYVRSLFVAEDETCFHVFESSSAEAVAEASRRAGLDDARIVEVSVTSARD
jgi:hypothetical protein